jgi:hypothetical protein
MKKIFLALVLCGLLTAVFADSRSGYEPATVIGVRHHETPSNYVGSNPSDAPLQARVYDYDVAIRLNCTVYQVRYESETNYMPAVFAPNHAVDVSLAKRFLYVSLPADRELRLGIESRRRLDSEACSSGF